MGLSKFANQHPRREVSKPSPPVRSLPKPADPEPEPPAESAPPARNPAGPKRPKPPSAKMIDVTVKLPVSLVSKLDRLAKKHSAGLARAGRSTVLRWLLDKEPE